MGSTDHIEGRQSRLSPAAEALADLRDGQTVLIGGTMFHNKPMALVREVARRRVRDLVVIAVPQASIDVELLLAAGCVAELRVPYVGFEYLGLAPRFRDLVGQGRVRCWDCDETHVLAGLEAAAREFPSLPVRAGVGTDLPKHNPALKPVTDPFTGEPMLAVAAIRPDLCLLHAWRGDRHGNLQYAGYPFSDVLGASATKRGGGRVVASVDELVPTALIEREPTRTAVPAFLVDAVVPVPWGAHPCSSHGHYQFDEAHLREYLAQGRTAASAADYLTRYVDDCASHDDYLARAVTPARLAALRQQVHV